VDDEAISGGGVAEEGILVVEMAFAVFVAVNFVEVVMGIDEDEDEAVDAFEVVEVDEVDEVVELNTRLHLTSAVD